MNTICENLGSWYIVWGHFVAMNLDYSCVWSMGSEHKTDKEWVYDLESHGEEFPLPKERSDPSSWPLSRWNLLYHGKESVFLSPLALKQSNSIICDKNLWTMQYCCRPPEALTHFWRRQKREVRLEIKIQPQKQYIESLKYLHLIHQSDPCRNQMNFVDYPRPQVVAPIAYTASDMIHASAEYHTDPILMWSWWMDSKNKRWLASWRSL